MSPVEMIAEALYLAAARRELSWAAWAEANPADAEFWRKLARAAVRVVARTSP